MSLRPRRLVHRGSVEAVGFLLDPTTLGPRQARSRVLELWSPGVRLRELESGRWLLTLVERSRVDCRRVPGAPLVEDGSLKATTELDLRERKQIAVSPLEWVDVEGGWTKARSAEAGVVLHPAEWIDLGDFEFVVATPLPVPPPPIVVEIPDRPPDPREALGGERLAAAEGMSEAARAAQRALGQPAAPARGESESSPARSGPGILDTLREWLRAGDSGNPPAGGGIGESVRNFFERMALGSRLGQLLGQQQARYMQRMMDMFDGQDLQEALRHAIPLAGEGEGEEGTSWAWGPPRPRDDLRLQPPATGGGRAMLVGGVDLYTLLQQRYRAAFERLDKEGKVLDAAFVLISLLGRAEEGVSYLERHGEWTKAAEMAERLGLAPDWVVRLWFRAGNVDRALQVARRHGCFLAAANRMLARGERAEAQALLTRWARELGEAGDYGGALAAIEPYLDERTAGHGRIRGWMDGAFSAGGPAAATALAISLELLPAEYERNQDRLFELIEDPGFDGVSTRLALAHRLVKRTGDSEGAQRCQLAARPLLRALVSDSADTWIDGAQLETLAVYCRDAVLRADLPGRSAPKPARPVITDPVTLSSGTTGTTPIRDVALLPGGRVLCALGEMGAVVLGPDGRRTKFFDQPAHQLVMADAGTRALALSSRGERQRVALLEIPEGRCRHWNDIPVEAFARSHDGTRWFVASEGRILALELGRDDVHAGWHVPGLPAPVTVVVRNETHLAFVTEQGELWNYELAGLTLRSRDTLAAFDPRSRGRMSEPVIGLQPEGGVAVGGRRVDEYVINVSGPADSSARSEFTLPDACVGRPLLHEEWVLAAYPAPDGSGLELMVGRVFSQLVQFTLRVPGAGSLVLRGAGPSHVVAADDQGRILVLDLDRSMLVREAAV